MPLELREMMAQVPDVVANEPLECHRVVRADDALRRELRGRDGFDRVRDMCVEGGPYIDQLGPRPIPVSLRGNPAVLFVRRKHKRIAELGTHNPLVIICGRISQMTEQLLAVPLAAPQLGGAVAVAESAKEDPGPRNLGAQLGCKLLHGLRRRRGAEPAP